MPAEVQLKTISDLIVPPENIPDVQAWYFHETGGNQFRLRIAYLLARTLDKRHNANRFFGCLVPADVVITSESPIKLDVLCPGYDYDNLPPEYADPMVLSGKRLLSAASDTYSYAVILFEMLTQCHPFKGAVYDACTAEEKRAGWLNGSFDYIGDYTCDNTNDDFEYKTHLRLSKELSVLFARMFTAGKTNCEERPLLTDFMSACMKAFWLTLRCEHGKYAVEYYGEDSYVCPYCKKKNQPLAILTTWKKVFSARPVLIPDSLSGEPEPVLSPRIFLNKAYMLTTDCGLTRSLFEEKIPYSSDSICVEVGIHRDRQVSKSQVLLVSNKKAIRIKNRLKSLKISVGEGQNIREVLPGEVLVVPAEAKSVVVFFAPDFYMNQAGEELLDIDDPIYGRINIRYYLQIEKGAGK